MSPPRGAQLAAGLSVLGLVVSAYLAVVHLALLRGDLFGGPLCGALGTAFNCHAVAASRLGQGVLGLPLAFWGLLGYVAALTLAVIAWQSSDDAPHAWTLLAGLSVAFLAVDAALLVVMLRRIGAVCLLCLATYLVNLALAVTAWRASARPWPQLLRALPAAGRAFLPRPRAGSAWAFWGVLLTAAAGVAAVQATAERFGRTPEAVREQIRQYVLHAPRVLVDTTGDPRRGAPDAPIRLVSFVDFFCPLCRETARYDAIIHAAHPRETSLVVKFFPLDQACNAVVPRTIHPGACQLAAAAECAHAQRKFWAFHDRVFRIGPTYRLGDLESDAQAIGLDLDAFQQCLAGGAGAAAVERDVIEAARLKLTGTPVTIVNGVVIQGTMTPAQFDELVPLLRASESSTAS